MIKKSWFLSGLLLIFIALNARTEVIKSGPWRFELEMANATVPFIVEFEFKNKRLKGKLHNGKETIPLTNIRYSGKKLSIPLQTYEVSLELVQKSPTQLSGHWVRHNKRPKVELPLKGVHGEVQRFPEEKSAPKFSLSGRWSVTLTEDDNKKSMGVVVFEQKDSHLSGSILTSTGDYRYFEGFVSGNDFKAASFDGMYNYLFTGTAKNGKLKAQILSNFKTNLEGKLDPKAELPDAYAQTKLPALTFSFPDLQGKPVTLKDKTFQGKPVIVQIFGSWCPNCLDEMNYLIPWYKENKKRGIEIVALSFERSVNEAEAKRQLKKLQKVKKVPYPLLIAGSTAEDKPEEKIQGLENFISFPTLIFLNKKHEVVKVHAGFTGPSTGEFYEKWKKEFNGIVDDLLE